MNPRAIRQYLESLHRAGVTHLPAAMIEDAVAPVAETSVAVAPQIVATDAATPAPSVAAEAPSTPPVAATTTQQPPAPAGEPVEPASQEARVRALRTLASRVAECTRCQELAATRRQTVFGVGNPDARIMFIGEAPGADEDRLGEPFVGKAGQLLDRIIEACHVTRDDLYICNILRCRPPGNRTPLEAEANNCREYLDAQIATVQPEYIVCWGSVAAQNLLGVKTSVGRMRGAFHSHGSARVLVTYHPSYLLRNPPAKKQVWTDMKFLFADMGVEL